MEDEHTAGFREPCAQCSAVDWGVSDEGRFYCRSCHNVIERTKEVVDPNFVPGSTRISTIGRGTRTKRPERGREWTVCEGFQFILRNQADALVRLGVSPHFKDRVLCQLWRLYLQRSGQAYTGDPLRCCSFKVRRLDSDSESVAESSVASTYETDGGSNPSGTAGSDGAGSSGGWSTFSGSAGAAARRRRGPMSMRKTLALIHLALIWSREPLTLSDLLRLVNEGHVPYVNAYELLPEEMRLDGGDALVFRAESVPSHRAVHSQAQALALYLQLRSFPPIGRQSLLHPALLTLRYLSDANLPDQLHPWVCRLMERAGMEDQTPLLEESHPVLPRYDLQAAALIIVTLKLIFGLDDHTEWDLSNDVGAQDDSGDGFSLRRWYRLVEAALSAARRGSDRGAARKQWKAKKPLYSSRKTKAVAMKKKRTAEQVRVCFEKLSSRPAGVRRRDPSSFRFCWGDEDGADGPSLHHQNLDRVLTAGRDVLSPRNATYWHPVLRPCKLRKCSSHYSEVEAALPRSLVWLLQLFSFLLDAAPADLYEATLRVERRVFGTGASPRKRERASGKVGGGGRSRTLRNQNESGVCRRSSFSK